VIGHLHPALDICTTGQLHTALTGLRTYPTYAMGGGYVLSGDVANMLVTVNLKMKLKFTPIEDATLGFWLMSMDLRHIDHRRFHTWAAPCCFKPPMRREGQRVVTRYTTPVQA